MSKTSLETKMEILGNIWLFYSEEAKFHEGWSEFFEWADVALPMSYLSWLKIVDVKPESEHYVHEAWVELCKMPPRQTRCLMVDGRTANPAPAEVYPSPPKRG